MNKIYVSTIAFGDLGLSKICQKSLEYSLNLEFSSNVPHHPTNIGLFENQKEIITLIEWPEKAIGYLPRHDLEITIDVLGEKRIIDVRSNSQSGEKICTQLNEVGGLN